MLRVSARAWLGVLILFPALTLGHSKLTAIDANCLQLQTAFANATPIVFSGPDPWVLLDDIPASMPDDAVAYLYTAGTDVRWVFVRVVDSDAGWSEDISYFFNEHGAIMKRERHLQSTASNISLDVFTYYEAGRVLKEKSRHHALARGKPDASQFNDPDAPTFTSVHDLPFPDIQNLLQRLA